MSIDRTDQTGGLTLQSLAGLHSMALRLGPLLDPTMVAEASLAACVELTNCDCGLLLTDDRPPTLSNAQLPSSEAITSLRNALAVRTYPAGMVFDLPAAGGPLPAAALLLGALPDIHGHAGIVLLGHKSVSIDDTRRAALAAALPLIGQALTRAHRYTELRKSEQSREQMINLLVHDIRSPLVATHASIEVVQRLLRGQAIATTVFDSLQTGLRSVRAAVDLCNDMLEVKRIQNGYQLDRRPVQLDELFAEVRAMLQSMATQRGCTLAQQVQPAGLCAIGDIRLLRRVLVNLLMNALRFVPTNGWIGLEAAAEHAGSLMLWVSDSGPGVAPADRERIFQPFVQGNGEVGRGTGLGLAFCHEVLLAHGGEIWVEDRPGGGCRFCLRLPAA